jgi:hypothetical protein
MTPDVLSVEQRNGLVAEYLKLLAPHPPPEITSRLDDIETEYRDGLPRPAIARCPHTGVVLEFPIDSYGIDGPWWNYENPVRPFAKLVPSCIAITGALHLNRPPESVPYLAITGPEVPFVIPRLLERPGMVAVISHLPVGAHNGYPVCYFEDPPPRDITRFNEWGTNRYWFSDDSGTWGWDQVFEDSEHLDFDLGPWLEARKLLWVAKGDATTELHSGTAGFPYTGIEGRSGFVRIQEGHTWEPDPEAEAELLRRLRGRSPGS